ncbi:hypothetical protein GF382_01855 [Candidatus Falkowbacteria bacterium]|nr:hypothetical protein [Candidatus Falkowbacteria bacterium]
MKAISFSTPTEEYFGGRMISDVHMIWSLILLEQKNSRISLFFNIIGAGTHTYEAKEYRSTVRHLDRLNDHEIRMSLDSITGHYSEGWQAVYDRESDILVDIEKLGRPKFETGFLLFHGKIGENKIFGNREVEARLSFH